MTLIWEIITYTLFVFLYPFVSPQDHLKQERSNCKKITESLTLQTKKKSYFDYILNVLYLSQISPANEQTFLS